jgi:hypothetical protein
MRRSLATDLSREAREIRVHAYLFPREAEREKGSSMYGSVRLFSPSIRFFHRPWRRESSITEEKRKENKWKIEKIEKEGEK